MLAPAWQRDVGACVRGDNPQTPYEGLMRTPKSLDGDGGFRPCARELKPFDATHMRGRAHFGARIVENA